MASQFLLSYLIREEKGMRSEPPAAAASDTATPSTGSGGPMERKFVSTKRFYEVYWFAMSVYGLTCDVLHRLQH